ncbi:unnamed protein product [Heterobilharzia americana]|nr:unnamed protein product [Heterobilharzia americana]
MTQSGIFTVQSVTSCLHTQKAFNLPEPTTFPLKTAARNSNLTLENVGGVETLTSFHLLNSNKKQFYNLGSQSENKISENEI